ELLEESSLETIKSGQTVKGIITSISPNEIHVDLGTKVTGIIAFDELTDNPSDKLNELFAVGQEIEARVIKVSDLDGVATLSKKQTDSIANWNKIVEAYNEAAILEGRIVEAVKSGVLISIGGVKVFIPASQSGVPKSGDLNTLIGTTQRVKIIDLNEQRRRAVASIRAVAREEAKAKEADFWANIEKDKKYEGVVKSLTAYGAFVDLGGVDGMVHSTELSWKRIKHPSDVVSIGDTITVYVKDFDPEAKRISLGYKTEETNPWNVFLNTYNVGDTAKVKIVSLMDFGAFAEVVPGTDGLIHISQIADRKIDKPADVLEVGQEVDAKIIDIDTEKRKISLSIRALLEASAEEAEEAAEENN
nr:S1 RNA-binding domain-containing protein [Clostridia bacterium]